MNHSSFDVQEPSEADLLQAIADSLAQGHVENILSLLRSDSRYYACMGRLLNDKRIAVRLGLAVLFEYVVELEPERMSLAIPGLAEQLASPFAYIRGDAAGLLITIGTPEALELVRPLLQDPSPEIVEMVNDALGS